MRPTILIPILFAAPASAITLPQGDPAPQNVEELAAALDRTHRQGAENEIPSFSAKLLLETIAEGGNTISFGLDVDFGVLTVSGRKRNLIKYNVQEEGRRIERGFGVPVGYWTQVDANVTYLTQAQHEQDRENVLRDIRLARQLLGYLDPGVILRGLSDTSDVTTEELKIGRRKAMSCRVVSGLADSFPLYHLRGEVGAAFLKIWVDEATGHLVGVEATPIDARRRPQPELREFIALLGHQERIDNVLLPRELKIFTMDEEGERQPQLGVVLMGIDLDPGFEPDHFRPTGE